MSGSFKGRKYTVGDLLNEEEPTVDLGNVSNGPRSGPFTATRTEVYPPGHSSASGHSRAVSWRAWRRKPTWAGISLAVGGFALGLCCSGAFAPVTPDPASLPVTVITVPVPAPAVTVTVTGPAASMATFPESCWDAIHQAGKILDDASAIASAGNRARDLISQAYQAAVAGDSTGMNAATDGLLELDRDLASHNAIVLPPWQDIMNGLSTCQEN